MTRLEKLKEELEVIKNLKCLSFALKEKVIEHYNHEIKCIEEWGSPNADNY